MRVHLIIIVLSPPPLRWLFQSSEHSDKSRSSGLPRPLPHKRCICTTVVCIAALIPVACGGWVIALPPRLYVNCTAPLHRACSSVVDGLGDGVSMAWQGPLAPLSAWCLNGCVHSAPSVYLRHFGSHSSWELVHPILRCMCAHADVRRQMQALQRQTYSVKQHTSCGKQAHMVLRTLASYPVRLVDGIVCFCAHLCDQAHPPCCFICMLVLHRARLEVTPPCIYTEDMSSPG
jgi:hypothetical protein